MSGEGAAGAHCVCGAFLSLFFPLSLYVGAYLSFFFSFFSSPFVGVVSFEAGRGTPCRHGDLTGGGNPAHRPQNAGPTIAAMWGASQKSLQAFKGKPTARISPSSCKLPSSPQAGSGSNVGSGTEKQVTKRKGGGNLQKKPPLSLQAETLPSTQSAWVSPRLNCTQRSNYSFNHVSGSAGCSAGTAAD